MVAYCGSCGEEVGSEDRFCRGCGKELPRKAPAAAEAGASEPLEQSAPPVEHLRERAAAAAREKKRRRDWAVVPALLALVAIIVILFLLMRTRQQPDEQMAAQPPGDARPAPESAPVPVPQVYVPGAPQPAEPAAPVQPPAETPAEVEERAPQPTPEPTVERTQPPAPPAPQPGATGPPTRPMQPAPRTGPGPVPQDYYEFWFRPSQYTGFSEQLEDLTDMELDTNVARVHVRLDHISRFVEGGTMMTWEGYDRHGRLVRRERRPLTMVDAGWLGTLGVDPATVERSQPRP